MTCSAHFQLHIFILAFCQSISVWLIVQNSPILSFNGPWRSLSFLPQFKTNCFSSLTHPFNPYFFSLAVSADRRFELQVGGASFAHNQIYVPEVGLLGMPALWYTEPRAETAKLPETEHLEQFDVWAFGSQAVIWTRADLIIWNFGHDWYGLSPVQQHYISYRNQERALSGNSFMHI